MTREERKIWLKVRLFGFPRACHRPHAYGRYARSSISGVVSSSTLTGPFEPSSSLTARPLARGRSQAYQEAEEVNFKPNCSFFKSLSTAEARVCGVKFIGFYGTVGFIVIRDFSF